MFGIMGLFVRRNKGLWDYFSVALRFSVGIIFICIERIQINKALYDAFINSVWPIPTVSLLLLFSIEPHLPPQISVSRC